MTRLPIESRRHTGRLYLSQKGFAYWRSLCILAILAVGGAFFFSQQSVRDLANSASQEKDIGRTHQVTPTSQFFNVLGEKNVPLKQSQAQISRELLNKLNGVQSHRELFYEFLKHPEQGGYTYALAILRACPKESVPGDESKLQNQLQQQALAELKFRCTLPWDSSKPDVAQLLARRDLNWNDDPLFKLLGTFTLARSDQERNGAVNAAAETQDPILIESILDNLGTGAGDSFRMTIAGQQYFGKSGEETKQLALTLIRCEFGRSCGPGSQASLNLCGQRGWCADSVDQSLHIGLGEEKYRVVRNLAFIIIAALRNGKGAALFIQSK